MKKSLFVIGICSSVIIAACSSNGSKSAQDTTPAMNQTGDDNRATTDTLGANSGSAPSGAVTASTTASSKGADLIAKMDCMGCHKEREKLVGPAYSAVAAKYEATDKNIDYLASKIISGGAGVWGTIPMTPHPNLSKEDATEMAKYVLTIK